MKVNILNLPDPLETMESVGDEDVAGTVGNILDEISEMDPSGDIMLDIMPVINDYVNDNYQDEMEEFNYTLDDMVIDYLSEFRHNLKYEWEDVVEYAKDKI